MAQNDTILIDGILDDRTAQRLPSSDRAEAFEYFVFEQMLRDFDLSREEIDAGWIDGRDDGGIDGFYILVNGHSLTDPDSFLWPRCGAELDVWLITCKHHDTFRQAPVDNLVASISELLDLRISNSGLKGAYSRLLLHRRTALIQSYRKTSPRLSTFNLHLVYASRGDTNSIGDAIRARADQAVHVAKDLFSNCIVGFDFYGAAELISAYRRTKSFSLELPFIEAFSKDDSYILLCRLKDYYNFSIDDEKRLRRYIFDSNVRAFMGLNRVNEDISKTLQDENSPDFWWLNNGITILADTATFTGKSMQIEGVQIVNGLQTTESIARYFGANFEDAQNRSVLVKVLVSNDSRTRDLIIRATNNQTAVESASLRATDKIQRDIEEVLIREGFYYERRTNYYTNQGVPASSLVSPLYLASGYVSMVLKLPIEASKLKSKFMRSDVSYKWIFSSDAPIKVWPSIARVLKTTDNVLDSVRPVGTGANERFLKNWRQLVSLIGTARVFRKFTYSVSDLANLNPADYNDELIRSTWDFVRNHMGAPSNWKQAKSSSFQIDVLRSASIEFALNGVQAVIGPGKQKFVELPVEFVEKVNKVLPEQPWKPGVHSLVANEIGCSSSDVYTAIQLLIENGQRYKQIDGIVYDKDGSIVARDASRLSK